ncbi:MAG: metalloregulator ArsR/SmtB family transcription factor [Coriobacteriia bacterium]|nr:metalloregulator ArsR/SmtB family transcription factor [Coriobacteriia bacterium]
MRAGVAEALAEEQLDSALKALASSQRREIVRFLVENTPEVDKTCCAVDEVCGCKLSERFGLAPSTISHHMATLTGARIVTSRKDGTWVYYTVRREVLAAVAAAIEGL